MIVFLFLAFAGGGAAFSAWTLMLLVGIAHHEWWSAIPPMSYSTAFTLMAVLVFAASVPSAVGVLIRGVR